jgi:hypothetical protein
MPRKPRHFARLCFVLMSAAVPACASSARPPSPARASPTPSAVVARPEPKPCPREAPVIDSSCEGFDLGTACLYAEDSVGCACSAAPAGEHEEGRSLTRVWRCGEHGELEIPR